VSGVDGGGRTRSDGLRLSPGLMGTAVGDSAPEGGIERASV